MSASKSRAPEASRATLAFGGSRVEVRAVTMDFVTPLPWTQRRNDAVWVIVDRLTKSAHFLAVRMTFTHWRNSAGCIFVRLSGYMECQSL